MFRINPIRPGILLILTFAFTLALPNYLAATGRQGVNATEGAFVRVMSFNIRYNNPADNENGWAHRKSMVASMLRFHRADLIGVQEALRDQIADLEQLAPEYAWCGVGRSDGKADGEFSAIFYRKARFELLDQSTFWLSETPEVIGSKGWDAALPRVVTWAKFRDRKTKTTFFHFNTHFDHRGERARAESARLLLKQIEKISGSLPIILTGDFNGNESSEPYRILTSGATKGQKLQDARQLSGGGHHGPTSTFNGFGALRQNMRIDYIFVRDRVTVLQHGVLADQWDGRWPSDHLPVLAELTISSK